MNEADIELVKVTVGSWKLTRASRDPCKAGERIVFRHMNRCDYSWISSNIISMCNPKI